MTDKELVPCEACRRTGFTDKVKRGLLTPGTCQPCRGSGWVYPETKTRDRPNTSLWQRAKEVLNPGATGG